MRRVGNRGYIDLLGVAKDRIHVVETKIGADPMLVLQGLDYWVWTTAHLPTLVPYLNDTYQAELPVAPEVVVDYVVGEKDGVLVSPYTAAQLEALDGSVPWRMHRIDGWTTPQGAVTSLGRRVVPGAARVAAPVYPVRLQRHLVAHPTAPLGSGPFFATPGGGIVAEAHHVYADLQTRHGLHRYVDHVRSSQAFAINLFGGLTEGELVAVWALLGVAVAEVDAPTFEYVDPDDALGELQPSRPHQTQVDVLLRARADDGARRVALIEVKLSETGFGSCSAFDAAANDRRDVCHHPGAWGSDTTGCFQLRNHNGPHRRRYDQHLDAAWINTSTTGCPFRELNQPSATSRSSVPCWTARKLAQRSSPCARRLRTPRSGGSGTTLRSPSPLFPMSDSRPCPPKRS